MFKPIKVVDVELSQTLVAIADLVGYSTVRALVRLRGVPLGTINVPVRNGRVEASDIHQHVFQHLHWPLLRQHLIGLLAEGNTEARPDEALLAAKAPAYAGPWPFVSVAVCTRNRADSLATCLTALEGLDYPGEFEVIVVDNAPSDDATERLVRERFPAVRYVREARYPPR